MTVSSQPSNRIDLRDYARIIVRRIWLVIIPAVVAIGVTLVATMPNFLPPVYESSATLMMEFPQPLSPNLQQIVEQSTGRDQFARLGNMIYGTEFLRKVIQRAGLSDDPVARQWAVRNASKYPTMSQAELVELYLTRYLRNAIDSGSDRNEPNVFGLRVHDHYPRRAMEVCTAIMNGIVEASNSITQEQVKATHDFALEQVALYKRKLQEAERKLQQYQSGIGSQSGSGQNISGVRGLQTSVQVEVENQKSRRTRLAASVRGLGQDADRWLWMVRPESLEELSRQYLQLVSELTRSEIQDLETPGTDGSTTALGVQLAGKRRELDAAFREMVAGAAPEASDAARDAIVSLLVTDVDVRAAERQEKLIEDQIASLEEAAARVPAMELEQARLTQEVETLREFYRTFMEQITSAQIAEAFEAVKVGGRVVVLDPPQLPLEPVSPNRAMIIVIAAVGGIMLGFLLLFIVEHHDTTVRDVAELTPELRDKVIGSLPLIRDRLAKEREYEKAGLKGKTVPIFDYYRDEAPSSFEFRRLVLELSSNGVPERRSLMVTSSESGEGKTTTACFLALTLARHRKQRTVLVDLDFRKPAVHREMGLPRHSPGAAEALMDRALNRDAVRPTAEPNLFVLPAGSFRNFSAEALTPESVRWLLCELLRSFDVAIVDTPPNLAVPDPLVIGRGVDAAIFVVKAGSTSKRVMMRGIELQTRANANLAGLVLNNIRDVMPHYFNYEHYGYAADGQAHRRRVLPGKPK
jgi:capsular exopolysaccharide synthesis family protein